MNFVLTASTFPLDQDDVLLHSTYTKRVLPNHVINRCFFKIR